VEDEEKDSGREEQRDRGMTRMRRLRENDED
jgi:hypothetical protein